MMKIIKIASMFILIIGFSACNNIMNNELENVEPENNIVQNDNSDVFNKTFEERTKEFEKLKREIQDSIVLTSNGYDAGIVLHEKSFGEIFLARENGNYVLDVSILDAVSFEKAEIDSVVKDMIDNNLETAKLGDFVISKSASAEQKKRLDFMQENDIVGIELDFWKEYSNTNWLNENGIPVYIQREINGEEEYLFALEKVNNASTDRYYMFKIQIAGQDGLYSIPDSSSITRVKINLLPNDKINIKEYEYEFEEKYDYGLKKEEFTNVEDYFNSNSEGKSRIILGTHDIKMENDMIYLEFYYGGI